MKIGQKKNNNIYVYLPHPMVKCNNFETKSRHADMNHSILDYRVTYAHDIRMENDLENIICIMNKDQIFIMKIIIAILMA